MIFILEARKSSDSSEEGPDRLAGFQAILQPCPLVNSLQANLAPAELRPQPKALE